MADLKILREIKSAVACFERLYFQDFNLYILHCYIVNIPRWHLTHLTLATDVPDLKILREIKSAVACFERVYFQDFRLYFCVFYFAFLEVIFCILECCRFQEITRAL